jgi:pimeloyl-ACP methyl ester carboxylesterase
MKFVLTLICIIGVTAEADCRAIHQQYQKVEKLLRIGPEPDRQIWMTEQGYTLILPDDTTEPNGLFLFFQRGRIDVDSALPLPNTLDYEALAHGIGILHFSTGNPLEFFFDDSVMASSAEQLQALMRSKGITNVPICIVGQSLGGTRALRFAQFLQEHKSDFGIQIAACVAVDAPLDFARFWHSSQRVIARNFHQAAADEARWVSYLLEQNLGGKPDDRPDAYAAYSVFDHHSLMGGRARLLAKMPVRAYHEPDIDWWIANRRKSYYDINSIDLAAFINELQLQGNESAELVTTVASREGYQEGSSPHTWSIVDAAELVTWFREIIEERRR